MNTLSTRIDADSEFPPLPIDAWEQTKNTLHLYLQIIGKVRMTLFPKMNHWWHVPLYVSPRGITTRLIAYQNGCFEIEFDFIDHVLVIRTHVGDTARIPLDGLSVAGFYKAVFENLAGLGVRVDIKAVPYDVPFSTTPFAEDRDHAAYDKVYVRRFWRILLGVNSVFETFRGRFIGKSTPVHLFWHHMDLALTRFSGRAAPPFEGGTAADREAYSHEVISFGFWAGDEQVREPAFYAYTYPEPKGLAQEPIEPHDALWNTSAGNSMAYLSYDKVRMSASPEDAMFAFLQSAYAAGARRADWDIEALALKTS